MFGNLGLDDIFKGIKGKNEFYVPISQFGSSDANKVSQKASFMDFLKIAQRRTRKMNPIAPNQADIVNWILYDTYTAAASATIPNLVQLFVTPIGGTKTKVSTNLQFVSQLEAPQWFNMTGMGFYFTPNTTNIDVEAFLSTEYMEFWVGNLKTYLEGPIQCFPGAAGLFGSTSLGTMSAAATSFTSNFTNGWPSVHNLYDVRLPGGLNLGTDANGNAIVADGLIGITILQSQSFKVKLLADGGGASMSATSAVPIPGTGLTIQCFLHGILSRGVA